VGRGPKPLVEHPAQRRDVTLEDAPDHEVARQKRDVVHVRDVGQGSLDRCGFTYVRGAPAGEPTLGRYLFGALAVARPMPDVPPTTRTVRPSS
jgi:hypothetical protein